MRTLLDWNGHEVTLAESKGGVLAFIDPFAGILRGGVKEGPPPEIKRKLSKSGRQGAFRGEDLDAVVEKLGFYCDLQSVNSEDAMTWNVFGPLIYAPESLRVGFCARLFHLIESQLAPPNSAEISLWTRKPHPESSDTGGPEFDFLIETPKVVTVGEAKWQSTVGEGQGQDGNKNQIDIRLDYLRKYGQRDHPTASTFVVLGVYLDEPLVQRQDIQDDTRILLRNVSWEDVCGINPHPTGEELLKHFRWKMKHSRRKRKGNVQDGSATFGSAL